MPKNTVRSSSNYKPIMSPEGKGRGVSGIYNRHPSPGLGSYPASKGNGDIDEKFAETGVGDANSQQNQLRQVEGVRREGKAPLVTTSNMNKSKNPYRSSTKK
jgi:hypothetical protein